MGAPVTAPNLVGASEQVLLLILQLRKLRPTEPGLSHDVQTRGSHHVCRMRQEGVEFESLCLHLPAV